MKQVLLTGKIVKRDGKVVEQTIRASLYVSIAFPPIGGLK